MQSKGFLISREIRQKNNWKIKDGYQFFKMVTRKKTACNWLKFLIWYSKTGQKQTTIIYVQIAFKLPSLSKVILANNNSRLKTKMKIPTETIFKRYHHQKYAY